jgi:quinolinate synthase
MSYKNDIVEKILSQKLKRKASIVAHNYQADEIQEIADVVGDSFALSEYCASNDASVIVFCGVRFMAENAKILAPDKTVLLPKYDAGCSMADMLTVEALREAKLKNTGAAVVCYVNSSAEVKAESDICCTSSNAVEVVRSVPQKDILFVPDINLGSYVSEVVPEKNIILWNGFCNVHHQVTLEETLKAKNLHPDALLLVHPECRKNVLEIANFVGSTKQIIDFATDSSHREFIIGTERGVLYALKKANPDKTFYMLSQDLLCPDMKKLSLKSVYDSLSDMKYRVELDQEVISKAKNALDRMLAIKQKVF